MHPSIWQIAEIKFVVILMEGCTFTCDLPIVEMLLSVLWEVCSVVYLIKDDINGNGKGKWMGGNVKLSENLWKPMFVSKTNQKHFKVSFNTLKFLIRFK